ncbi:adenosylcobinamide amidohydrolase [Leptospira fainei serovar Hurstbridge str. BUT 6]|uniref:Adenosylcobinamide amidohydrolase n=1 Tax=Leptospira fainei serovar Hurstbridge str. BUT 6 TaxID=1193011 RepID=S3UUL9_9LEPT|nr:adenosylcobinamide amidohydrolase [Leptospira fainei]EPG72943.1 adenosylcobinamide amidohydrolase [Leptospira fainei serovar Hurstbridge str. BUT 6]
MKSLELEQSTIKTDGTWLDIDLQEMHSALSWTVLGGGWTRTRSATWLRVSNEDLPPGLNPTEHYRNRLIETGREINSIGFLTSASLFAYTERICRFEKLWVRCVSTVGLGNAVRVGEPHLFHENYGTINLLVQTSVPLNLSASIEAVSIATEARTLAILEGNVQSISGFQPATGTGTDCIGIVSPEAKECHIYAGKHTDIGHLIGSSAYQAVQVGVEKWKLANKVSTGTM